MATKYPPYIIVLQPLQRKYGGWAVPETEHDWIRSAGVYVLAEVTRFKQALYTSVQTDTRMAWDLKGLKQAKQNQLIEWGNVQGLKLLEILSA